MADQDRRRRFAGRLQRLLSTAIEEKAIREGVSLARLIMQLNGWNPEPNREDPQEAPAPASDVRRLLESLDPQPTQTLGDTNEKAG